MAPSPTGEYHIGHIRTLLYNYALAKQNNGQFIIRIEDTDQKRLIVGAQEKILQVIKDYGLSWDEGPDIGGPYGPYVQTQRLDIYQKYIKELLDKGLAYYCFCSEERLDEMRETQKTAKKIPKYDRKCLSLSKKEIDNNLENKVPFVIRMKMPENEIVEFEDIVRGKIKINTKDLDDQVLIKSNGIPTYHLAVVVDDYLMKITHVLRGDEWISSTPKHILLYRYFGWKLPIFGHLSVFLDPSGQGKMSKRKGSVSAQSFLDDGYLPEALLNFLMLLGWNPGTEKELFTLDEFIKEFSLKHLHKKQPIFDRKKLDFLNGYYIRQKSNQELEILFKNFLPKANDEQIKTLVPILKDRIIKLGDIVEQTKFIFEDVEYDGSLLSWYKDKKIQEELVTDMLKRTIKIIEGINEYTVSNIQKEIDNLLKIEYWRSEDFLTGRYYMVLRVAICGSKFTPPVIECLPILGKEATLRKLKIAINKL